MNEDLKEIEKEIARRSLNEAKENFAKYNIDDILFGSDVPKETPPKDKAGALVEEAFGQAIVAQVANNTDVQEKMLRAADKVIENKVNAIEARGDMEDKEAHFNNKKNACECFGYNESTTEKWAVSVMNVWHNIMTALWLFAGFISFAPITFVAKKITVIFKKTWVAILVSIVIYLVMVVAPIVIGLAKK